MRLLIPIIVLLFTANLHASIDKEMDQIFENVNSQNFQILTHLHQGLEDDHDKTSSIITEMPQSQTTLSENGEKGLTQWVPNGKSFSLPSVECQDRTLHELILKSPALQLGSTIDRFFNRCKDQIARNGSNPYSVVIQAKKLSYKIHNNPRVRPVKVRLDDGTLVRGYLAIKPVKQKLPMVIARCGLFCNVGGTSLYMTVMHLFDEAPFNVLMLANSSGSLFQKDNGVIAFGGFDEGMQLLRIAKAISQNDELNKRTLEYHSFTYSLGSHGSLYAGLYNTYNQNFYPKIKSQFSVCPVVDLKPTINSTYAGDFVLRKTYINLVTLKQLREVFRYVPVLGTLLNMDDLFDDAFKGERTLKLLTKSAIDYYSKKTEERGWALAPFKGVRIKNEEDFWRVNNFLTYADQSHTPTFVFTSKDDWIVLTDMNTSPLQRFLESRRNSPIQSTVVPHGNHCLMNMAYGWSTISTLYKSYFLSHSKDFYNHQLIQKRSYLKPLLKKQSTFWNYPRLGLGEKHYDSQWKLKKGESFAHLTLTYWDETKCNTNLAYKRYLVDEYGNRCTRKAKLKIPLHMIDEPTLRSPLSKAEAQAMTRWANANLNFVDAWGKPVHMSGHEISYLSWVGIRE